ncbi:MAG: hypothetical protein JWM05_348 [Acidimicrobiales bacterium]|nr:hypothetical protein [Acidimicrobiales bacterium]
MEPHHATIWEAVADAIPDAEALVQGEVRRSWAEFEDRSARLAAALLGAGLTAGSKVGELLYNAPEYMETFFAALKIRAVPFNVNYRYVTDELRYLLDNADCEALVFHSSLGSRVAAIVDQLPQLRLLVEVADDDHHLDGAVDYEELLAASAPAARIERSPDDITMVYTGGTTGMPKGVMQRIGDTVSGLLTSTPALLGEAPTPDPVDAVALATRVHAEGRQFVTIPAPPLMHLTALGIGALPTLLFGGKVVLLNGRKLDLDELWDVTEAERVNSIIVVGDAFTRPMLKALDDGPTRDLSSVSLIASSGAMFSVEVKTGLLEHLPQAFILDFIAATEGAMGMSMSTKDRPAPTGHFMPSPGVIVVAEDGAPVVPGSDEVGFVALPGGAQGYFKDEVKTAATFRIIDGIRYTIPGDFATVGADGSIQLLGRGSQCINTAGEKVFPEEVEEAIKSHPSVEDCLVFGLPDERFGQRVVAVVSRAADAHGDEDLLADVRTRLASYKLPRQVVTVGSVPRTAAGKADYPEARRLFEAAPTAGG